jgi:hypothetical protein
LGSVGSIGRIRDDARVTDERNGARGHLVTVARSAGVWALVLWVIAGCGGADRPDATPLQAVHSYLRAVHDRDGGAVCALSSRSFAHGCDGHAVEDGDVGEAVVALERGLRYRVQRVGTTATVVGQRRRYVARWRLDDTPEGWRLDDWRTSGN